MSKKERVLNQEQIAIALDALGVFKTDVIAQRLVGLQNTFDGMTLEAVGKLTPSVINHLYRANNQDWISDEVQIAVDAVAQDSNVFTSDKMSTFISYLSNCNEKNPLIRDSKQLGAMKRRKGLEDSGIEIVSRDVLNLSDALNDLKVEEFVQ